VCLCHGSRVRGIWELHRLSLRGHLNLEVNLCAVTLDVSWNDGRGNLSLNRETNLLSLTTLQRFGPSVTPQNRRYMGHLFARSTDSDQMFLSPGVVVISVPICSYDTTKMASL
jgi:hypothetical protein